MERRSDVKNLLQQSRRNGCIERNGVFLFQQVTKFCFPFNDDQCACARVLHRFTCRYNRFDQLSCKCIAVMHRFPGQRPCQAAKTVPPDRFQRTSQLRLKQNDARDGQKRQCAVQQNTKGVEADNVRNERQGQN